MGPARPPPPPPPYHHGKHHQQQQHNDDDDIEVRKIYLLQPMPHPRPQPHLKGGGFMGAPVQNNIHLGTGMGQAQLSMLSPGKHRHGGGGGQHQQQQFSFQQQEEQPRQQHQHQMKSVASEVKILPIVVIPPMAPMPSLQVAHSSQAHVPRMTLTPQFNNYVLTAAGSRGDRKRAGGGRHTSGPESFTDYGGSLGGSVFRERYAGKTRQSTQANRSRARDSMQAHEFGGHARQQRDFDYGDYEQQGATYDDAQWSRRQRRGGGGGAPSPSDSHRHRVKSIRDVIEQTGEPGHRQQVSPLDDELGVAGNEDYEPRYLRASSTRLRTSPRELYMAEGATGAKELGSAQARAPGMEISLDELGALERDYLRGSSYQYEPVSNSPHYKRDFSNNLSPDSYLAQSGHAPRPGPSGNGPANYRLPRHEERHLFDDDDDDNNDDGAMKNNDTTDQWRFDSVKSVSHAAPNGMTAAPNEKTTTTTRTSAATAPAGQENLILFTPISRVQSQRNNTNTTN